MAINRNDITAGFGYGAKVAQQVTREIAGKGDNFIDRVFNLKIDERVDFNDMNYEFMKRFMYMNINEKDITLNSLGNDAHYNGDSTAITGQAQSPSYTRGVNYRENFASRIDGDEQVGINSTRQRVDSNKHYKDPYSDVNNLYPDELDSGTFNNKWKSNGNKNSILYKTKEIFRQKKINTIISKFGTSVDDGEHLSGGLGDRKTREAGMSHGKNLLKAGAEKDGTTGDYNINGYNNPYCRVWTHHYQYDRLDKLIRPFTSDGWDGENEISKLSDIHEWKNFNVKDGYGWKSGNVGWDKSSLDDNGFVKITPKYGGGGKNNIHTKDCMFSIENLAWRGYDPYSFEQALSWEQRGPLGGRIMWFPPYGLSFNETTQANWSSNTFIGRGEDVYTYVNTVRSGTLSFIMLTDHPSVVDYANWYDGNGGGHGSDDLTDTDLLRFFAGCDSGDSNDEYSLFSKTKPTPLTDEYTQRVIQEIKFLDPNPRPPRPAKKEDPPEDEKEIQFHVFYPNNYSGVYDMPSNKESSVHAIAYLLFGKGSQKTDNGENDMPLSFATFDKDKSNIGNGYEMNGDGVTYNDQDDNGNYIVGSKMAWDRYNLKTYVKNDKKRWYYRIDGKYEVPISNDEKIKNTYAQTLYDSNRKLTLPPTNTNYKDIRNFNLNKNYKSVIDNGFSNEDEDKLYSLAEVAAVIEGLAGHQDAYRYLTTEVLDYSLIDRVDKLKEVFNTYTVSGISIDGYSNSHGANALKSVNDKRNESLSRERANTVKEWLKECGIVSDNTEINNSDDDSNKIGHQVTGEDSANASGLSAKLYRSTRVTIKFKLNDTSKLSDSKVQGDGTTTEYQKYDGFTFKGKDKLDRGIYQADNGDIWYEDANGFLKKKSKGEVYERNALAFSDYDKNEYGRRMLYYINNTEDNSMNKVRYDQEYYFFKHLEKDNPIIFNKLTEKLKYFDPAFHSMTPEGFNARLTFLNQCTRQGNSISPSDGRNANAKAANNLAFGRPPFCVLRIGDFYYQTIVIDSINIDYNVSGGLQWDLNPEGAGVQPMLAQVNISFKFIGGGDLGGPIRRLQNAMTFNYYANARLYDNRADRITYTSSANDKEIGALDYSIKSEDSYAYVTEMAK